MYIINFVKQNDLNKKEQLSQLTINKKLYIIKKL